MSKVKVKHPEDQVSTGAYSAAILIDGWLYVSGQGPLDLEPGNVVGVALRTRPGLLYLNR